MSESIPMVFEVYHDRPMPRLFRHPDGTPRVADGAKFLSLEQAAQKFAIPAAELEDLWLETWADLINRDYAGDLLKPPTASPLNGAAESARLEMLHAMKYADLGAEHFAQLVETARSKDLNLWSNELYGKLVHNERTGRPELVVCVGIYGMRKIARRTNQSGSIDGPRFIKTEDGKRPLEARLTVYRYLNGVKEAFEGHAMWDDCAPEPGVSEFWDRSPFSALEYRAEAKAWRKGYGEEIAGLSLPDEADDRQRRSRRPSTPEDHTGPANIPPGDEPPTTRIGFEIAAKDLGYLAERQRSHIIAMLKSQFPILFANDERAFWVRAFTELRRNPQKFSQPGAS